MMTFDDWMIGISAAHKTSDDGITLRMLRACWAEAQTAERERICAAIKAADDKASGGDYMLDSDDCIKVVRGQWVRNE
jgi:hypothetical protein